MAIVSITVVIGSYAGAKPPRAAVTPSNRRAAQDAKQHTDQPEDVGEPRPFAVILSSVLRRALLVGGEEAAAQMWGTSYCPTRPAHGKIGAQYKMVRSLAPRL